MAKLPKRLGVAEARRMYDAIRKRAFTHALGNARIDGVIPRDAFEGHVKKNDIELIKFDSVQWFKLEEKNIRPEPEFARQFKRWTEQFAGIWRAIHVKAFNDFVQEFLVGKGIEKPTPSQWVKAALIAPFPCSWCNGTGRTRWGVCFRCNGKGYQTDEDARRNYGWALRAPAF